MDFAEKIRSIPDFPKEGILFRDITTLLQDKEAYHALIDAISEPLRGKNIDLVVGPEARGFVLGAPIAYCIGAGFVPARKEGKLPFETISSSYGLEYGNDSLYMHKDAIQPGQRVIIADDLLATGGTALATAKMVEELGGEVVGFRFIIELADLKGRETLKGYDVESVIVYE